MISCGNDIFPANFINDGIPDCYSGEDEETDHSNYPDDVNCTDITNIPCFHGDTQCFPVKRLCLYVLYDALGPGFLQSCRNGKHLSNCRDFTCPHLFKCTDYYCVPYKYTCDGKQDCPFGDDELSCSTRNCSQLFQCKNSNRCLHFHDVADGIIDCPEGDDELFSELPACPFRCNCLMSALTSIGLLWIYM